MVKVAKKATRIAESVKVAKKAPTTKVTVEFDIKFVLTQDGKETKFDGQGKLAVEEFRSAIREVFSEAVK